MFKRFQASVKQNVTNLVASKWYYWFLALISFVFVLLFSRSTSPVYAYVGYDAAIFKQMGMAILKGKTIYLDYFDNKGCLLYFLHALCLWLGGDFVILIFQAISLTISLIILDKIISFYKEGASRVYVLLAGLVLLLCFYEGGDLSEEWSLPFICYPLYRFLKSYKEDKSLNAKDLYFIGLCFGVIAFLRINNAVPFCGFLLCLFIGYLWKKQWKSFIINVLAFVGGVLTIAIPCFLYFYLKAGAEGVNWMVYGTFLSGFDYLGVVLKIHIAVIIFYYLILVTFIIIHVISLRGNRLNVPVIIAYLLFLLTFGTKSSEHYQMVMLPVYVLCLAGLNIQIKLLKRTLMAVLYVCVVAFLMRPIGFLLIEATGKDKFGKAYSDFLEKLENIPETERDSIYNYNTVMAIGSGLLYSDNRIQSNQVLFPYLEFWLNDLRENHKPLSETKPLWVMISHGIVFPDDMPYLRDNYEERFVFHYDTRYMKDYRSFGVEDDIYFFRRK